MALDLPAIVREKAELDARAEAEKMGEETREEARRALLQEHHDAQIKKLSDGLDKLGEKVDSVSKRQGTMRIKIDRELASQTRILHVILVLVLLGMFGATTPGQQLAMVIIQGLSKGFGK